MFKIVIVFSFLVWINLYAGVEGEGKFFFNEDDSLAFIKRQLLFSATQDVLSKEMKSMGLDSTLFWEKFEERFEKAYQPHKDSLKSKMGIGTDEFNKLSESEKSQKLATFEKELRTDKLDMKTRFGKISSLVQSYSIKESTRSTQFANARYMTIDAEVDRKQITAIYNQFLSNEAAKHYQTLYISTKFNLQNAGWTDLGVDLQQHFTDVVRDHWKKWFEENLKGTVDKVVLADDSFDQKFEEYSKFPVETSQSLNFIKSGDAESFDSWTNNSLWLKVEVDINKLTEDKIKKNREFLLAGQFVFIDLSNNLMIDFYDFQDSRKIYSYENNQTLSSALASNIYHMPFERFAKVGQTIGKLPSGRQMVILELNEMNNILDLLMLQDLLSTKGVVLQFEPKIHSFTKRKGEIHLFFQGTEDKLNETLLSLQGEKIGERVISIPKSSDPYTMRLAANPKSQGE